jgi:hypothetical protein
MLTILSSVPAGRTGVTEDSPVRQCSSGSVTAFFQGNQEILKKISADFMFVAFKK